MMLAERERVAKLKSLSGLVDTVRAQQDEFVSEHTKAWQNATNRVLLNLQRGRQLDFAAIKLMMQRQSFFRIESGRYFVAISL